MLGEVTAQARRPEMLTEVRYEDGLVLRGRTEEEMVACAETHIRDIHPELGEVITRDQVLVTVREAPFVLRANGLDPTQRVFHRRCPFADWELSLVYGLRWDPSAPRRGGLSG
jgi:hypothetical protein